MNTSLPTWPDLGTWHDVPHNAILPEGVPLMEMKSDGTLELWESANRTLVERIDSINDGSQFRTQHPLIPTTPGTTITCTLDAGTEKEIQAILRRSTAGGWFGIDDSNYVRHIGNDETSRISDWTEVPPNTPHASDPLDELNTADRYDNEGYRWMPTSTEWFGTYTGSVESM